MKTPGFNWADVRQKERNKARAIRREDNRERTKLIRRLKDRPCADCGRRFPPECMDFDHVPGRGGKISTVGTRGSITAIFAEAKKCDVVCAVCHRIRTRKRHQSGKQENETRRQRLDAIALTVELEREHARLASQPKREPIA